MTLCPQSLSLLKVEGSPHRPTENKLCCVCDMTFHVILVVTSGFWLVRSLASVFLS
jgi:hypothetical protein